jgi:SAM-dependent methyltransferase
MKNCRICNHSIIKNVGTYSPYIEYQFEVYECGNCGSRFVLRDGKIYDSLHNNPYSYYSAQTIIASRVKLYMRQNKPEKLRRFLSRNKPQYQFVIDSILNAKSKNNSILEVGCSRGYLTAFFLLLGYNIQGVDISPTAIQSAMTNFGNHFKVINEDNDLADIGKFDIIFHIGTIGCVEDPIKVTNHLIDILNPGGILLFNVPNLAAVQEMNSIWTNTAPPPDVVTLFDASFWDHFFSDKVDIQITYEPYDHKSNLVKHVGNLLKRPYLSQRKVSINDSQTKSNRTIIQKIPRVAFNYAPLFTRYILPRYTAEYGMYVRMTKPR